MITTVAIVAAAVIVVGAIEAPVLALLIGRWKRSHSYTNVSYWQPPVPDTDEDWLTVPPTDWTVEEMEQAAYDADFVDTIRREFPQYGRDFA